MTATNGAGVAGVTVTFAVTSGGGTVSQATATTDAAGIAQATLTLGPQAGENTITATTQALPGKAAVFSVRGQARYTNLATGGSHVCANAATSASASVVYCWGANTFGGLGDGSTVASPLPKPVTGLPNVQFTQLTAGAGHTCALQAAGALYCWGFNATAQVGDGTTTMRTTAVMVPNSFGRYSSVAAGGVHTCGRLSAGTVECWGDNVVGQIGDGTTTRAVVPKAVLSGGVALSDLKAGGQYNCAVGNDSEVYCWGRGDAGQLGIGSAPQKGGFSKVLRPSGVTLDTPVLGENHTCAKGSDAQLYCWGNNSSGQLGDASLVTRLTPVAVSSAVGVPLVTLALKMGGGHSCALTASQAIYCWGQNTRGQLGEGTNQNRTQPAPVQAGATKFTSVSLGGEFTCATTTDYRIMCWGSNNFGQLGDGTTTHRSTPVAVAFP